MEKLSQENKSMDLYEKIKIGKFSRTTKDWLLMIPKSYKNMTFIKNFNNLKEDIFYVFKGKIVKSIISKKNLILSVEIFNEKGEKKLFTIIQSQKLRALFIPNKIFVFAGEIKEDMTIFYPVLTEMKEGVVPVYEDLGIIGGKQLLTFLEKKFLKSTSTSLQQNSHLSTFFMENLLKIHKPENVNHLNESFFKLLKMEIAIFRSIFSKLNNNRESMLLNAEINIPFELTSEQKSVWSEINGDLENARRSIRLIYGEVGCGKTILGVLATNKVLANKKKVIVLLPTSLLAQEIFKVYNNFFGEKVKLVTGNKILEDGEIFIGTHALFFREKIANVGLLIVDEQHRFGVLQRNSLVDNSVDILMMSATPIPRTTEMIMNGLIKVSKIKEKPIDVERKTLVVHSDKTEEIFEKTLKLLENKKVLWVLKTIKLAEYWHERFKEKIESFLINGKSKKKEDILKSFENSNGILIATTVVEVGLNINVDYIFILDAHMFGLAQIHQLRGRVGRFKAGVCVLVGKNLKKLREISHSCGFKISQIDLSNRGSGKIAGIEQSGHQNFFFNLNFLGGKILECEQHFLEKAIEESKNLEPDCLMMEILYPNKEILA